MSDFTIAFNTRIKAVSHPDWEKHVALRLLDILLGREMACTPDPVPYVDGKYMLGHSNDFWLHPLGDGRYKVSARYAPQEYMDNVAAVVRHQFRSQLLQDGAAAA